MNLDELRRIAIRAQLLADWPAPAPAKPAPPLSGGSVEPTPPSATSVLDTVRRLGFLQLDPISTVAPPQQLVLYSRLGAFDVAELDRLLWEERALFEWHSYIWPVEDLPLVRARMRRRRTTANAWTRDFLQANARFRRYVLRELDRNGPLLSRDLDGSLLPEREAHRWWGSRDVRLMLELLHARGEIAVAGRAGRQRLWDIAERVYPESGTIPWREASRLIEERQRRSLGVWLERGELRAHPEALVGPVPDRVVFLSPFDRLVHDRDRAEALFGFRYRLEMYVPKAKREYGYYVLPILHGDRLVGRIDPVVDRREGVLRVNSVHWEPGAEPVDLAPALRSLADWLGAREVADPPTGGARRRSAG